MSFMIVPAKTRVSEGQGLILRQDNWNDYGFKTLYQLYLGNQSGAAQFIGNVKLLRKGQTDADPLQLRVGKLEHLGPEFCSVGQDLDYYERLAALGIERRMEILQELHDIVQDPGLADNFREEAGWDKSLFRDFDQTQDLPLAKALIDRDYDQLPDRDLSFSFSPTGWDALSFDFTVPDSKLDSWSFRLRQERSIALPGRMIVLVGRNGSGKSTILARLARVIHASKRERRDGALSLLGKIDPPGLGFTRIVAVNYSAFDSFSIPGLTRDERLQVAKEVREGTGRYMFCGLRDVALEAEVEEAALTPATEDRQATNRLKSLDRLTDEFVAAIGKMDADRARILRECAAPIFLDPSIYVEGGVKAFLAGDNLGARFHALSTGHKIVLHVICSIVSHVQRKSLVLFDEPEAHLHPPLLAALMHALRQALRELDAFAIVATHSPVVVQETLSRQVHVVATGGAILPAQVETFGEGIGLITNEVFSLGADVTDYHSILHALVDTYNDLKSIEALFDRGLSTQARAYVAGLLAARSRPAS